MTSRLRRAAVLLALLTPLASCNSAGSLDNLVPKDEDAYARGQIEAVARGDTAGLMRSLDPSLAGPGAAAEIGKMVSMYGGRRIEHMEVIGYAVNVMNGVRHRNVSYQLRLAGGAYVAANVASRTEDGRHVIEGATVNPLEGDLRAINAFTVAGKPPLHLLFLALAILLPLFTLGTAVLAYRTNPGQRWRWVLLSLVGVGRWALNWTTGQTWFNVVTLQLFGAGMLRPSPFMPWVLGLSLPVGALWVWMRYLGRPNRPAEPQPVADAPASDPDEAPVATAADAEEV